ncbi:MAG TPA: RNA pseudouridine synthase [Bacteroidales bacterium]|nr:RNA pseudouridine synthase [Bacteroidales bacterium]
MYFINFAETNFFLTISEKHIVRDVSGDIRLSDYIIGKFETLKARKGLKKAILDGRVLINGKKGYTADYVRKNDVIELCADESEIKKVFQLKIEVIFEDEFLAVINKPAGFPVSGNYYKTIQNALPFNLSPSTLPDALAVARPVHRLDNQTRGLLLVAKTRSSQLSLHKQFEENQIQKKYCAVVIGTTEKQGIIIDDIEGKYAETQYIKSGEYKSAKFGFLTVVDLFPKTGRTHQLRIHLAKNGTHILGDKLYGNHEKNPKDKGLFLAATGIRFMHPGTNLMTDFQLELPEKFSNYLKRIK